MVHRNSFSDKVRRVYRAAGSRPVKNAEASVALDLVFDKDKRPLYMAQRDLVRAGELEKIAPGVYRYIPQAPEKPLAREVMWRLLRARRAVSINDLMELAGVTRNYATEWIYTLQRREIVRRVSPPGGRRAGGKYQLIKDVVEMPVINDNADKLVALRARKKQDALDALDRAWAAVAEARMAVANIDIEIRQKDGGQGRTGGW